MGDPDPHKFYISGAHSIDHENDEDEDSEGVEVGVGIAIVEGNATSQGVTRANAKFIVRACNAHDRLVVRLGILALEADNFAAMYQELRDRIKGKGIEPGHLEGRPEIHQLTMDSQIRQARELLAEINKEDS
jgi:hypothetical protein